MSVNNSMRYRTNQERGFVGCSRLGEDNFTSRRSFDFEEYQSGSYLNWGPVMTINDDTTKSGFITAYHEHKNLDILSYVVKGKVKHHDNLGNELVAQAGQVQWMSCGNGIWHTEANPGPEDNRYLQIWIASNQITLGWDPKYTLITRQPGFNKLPAELKNTKLEIWCGELDQEYEVDCYSYLLVLDGSCSVDEFILEEGDSLEIDKYSTIIPKDNPHIILFKMLR